MRTLLRTLGYPALPYFLKPEGQTGLALALQALQRGLDTPVSLSSGQNSLEPRSSRIKGAHTSRPHMTLRLNKPLGGPLEEVWGFRPRSELEPQALRLSISVHTMLTIRCAAGTLNPTSQRGPRVPLGPT